MSYNYQKDDTVFDTWLEEVVGNALCEGLLGLRDIKELYDKVSKVSYDNGYKHGKNDGYLQAVADVSEHKD